MFAHAYQKLFIDGLGRTTQGFENMNIPVAIVSAAYVSVVELVGSVLVLAGALITAVAACYLIVMVGAAVFVHIPTASSPRTTAGNSSARSRRSCSCWPRGPAGGASTISSVPARVPSRPSNRPRRPPSTTSHGARSGSAGPTDGEELAASPRRPPLATDPLPLPLGGERLLEQRRHLNAGAAGVAARPPNRRRLAHRHAPS
jgi:hypothetical protein